MQPLVKARKYLETLCNEGAVNDRLPPIKDMAVSAQVGLGTMWRAVRSFKESGHLSVRPRRGVVISTPVRHTTVTEAQPVAAGAKWLRTAATLASMIDKGVFASAAKLPSHKALCAQLGVNHRTLRKAFNHLTSTGVLERLQRSYSRVILHSGKSTVNRIVLIARGGEFGELSLPIPRVQYHLAFLELYCAQAQLRLEVVPLYYKDRMIAGFDALRHTCASEENMPIGFMLWTAGLWMELIDEAIRIVRPSQRPVAILDEINPDTAIQRNFTDGRFRLFAMGQSAMPGVAAARHFHGQGHRRILYIGTGSAIWSDNRYEGLRQEIARLGEGCQVERIDVSDSVVIAPINDAVQQIIEKNLDMIVDEFDAAGSAAPMVFRRVRTQLRVTLEQIRNRHQTRQRLSTVLVPHLKKFQADAIVACNDWVALDCLDVLNDRTVAVPGKMAVIGFDDTQDAVVKRLTSYNFNNQSVIHSLLNHLTSFTSAQLRKPFKGIEESEGFFVVRQTG